MFMVAASYKLLGQVSFLVAGIICLRLGEVEIGKVLIYSTVGSLVPVGEKRGK
jgi:hypothetical protein